MSDAHRAEIAKLEGLYQENPEGRIFAHLAEAHRKGGELDRAHQVLSEGLERHPDYSSAHVVRGRVLMDQGRAEEAEDAFRRVLDLDPQNLIAIRSLGDLARSRGDDDQALEFFHRLLEQEPGEDEVREIVDAMTGGPDAPDETAYSDEERDATFAAAPLTQEEHDTGLRTETIAQVYARQGLYDLAAEVYRELSRARPDDDGLRDRLAEMEQLAAAQTPGAPETEAVSDFSPEEPGPVPGLESTAPQPEEAEPEAVDLEGFEAGELDTTGVEAAPVPGLEADEADPDTGLRADAAPDTAEPDETLSEELDVTDVPEPPEEEPWADERAVKRPEPEWLSEGLSADDEPAGDYEEPDYEEPDYEEPEHEEAEHEEPEVGELPDGAAESEEEDAESVWAGVDWGEEPAETPAETPHAWTEEEEEVDASPPIRDYFSGLLSWPESGDPAPPGGSHSPAEEDQPDALEREVREESDARPDVPESPEDDDDLDMFRSWLESLKQ